MSKQLKSNQITLDILINSNDYYLTNLDIWLLANKLNLPIILYSGTDSGIKENNKNMIVLNSDESNSYFFIKSPNQTTGNVPEYRLLIESSSTKKSKIPLTSLRSMELQNTIIKLKGQDNLLNFLANPPKKIKLKLKKKIET